MAAPWHILIASTTTKHKKYEYGKTKYGHEEVVSMGFYATSQKCTKVKDHFGLFL